MVLYYAPKSWRIRDVMCLLGRGVDAHGRDGNGFTALNAAECVGHVKVAGVLWVDYEKEREPLWGVCVGNMLGAMEIGG